jgi:hypothetical protein
MGDMLRVNGSPLRVLDTTATEPQPDLKGGEQALDDNTLQNSQRDPKRKFGCVVKFDPPSDYDTFLAIISVGGSPGIPTPVTVDSDSDGITRGVSLSMWVRAGEVRYRTKGAGIFKTTMLSVPLAFREV